jgi:serine/threonine-protein kinase
VSARAPAQPGEVIADKYVVKGVIGRGGVGVVLAADHKTLDCPVALKFLRPEIAHEPETVQRFLREARAAARLRSEHVARVMDADSTEDGTAYLVMELLEGRDFAAIVKEEGRLPVETAVGYMLQACEAVAEAHSVGIVHRDLKSANLFLTRRSDGTPLVKVLDFGLSKVDKTPSQVTLTTNDHVMGSPHFMSPEQMRSSREVDARSDIWSLGVILYTLLAGRVPFEGVYLTEVCAAVLSGSAPALVSLRADVPRELAAAVERCLRLEPGERFQTVAALVAALSPFGGAGGVAAGTAPGSAGIASGVAASAVVPSDTERTSAAPPPGPRPRRRTALLALGAASIALLGATAALHAARRPPAGDALPSAALGAPGAITGSAPVVEPPAAPGPATASAGAVVATPSEPVLKRPAPPRRTLGSGPRRAAAPPSTPAAAPPAAMPPATPAAPPAAQGRPKTDEDVILGLPH